MSTAAKRLVAPALTALILACMAAPAAAAPAGAPDPSFGAGGKVQTIFSTTGDIAADVAVQQDGKIVAVGTAVDGSSDMLAIARYNTDGSLDGSFGAAGKVVLNPGYVAAKNFATAVAIQPDGKIVVAGYAKNGGDYDFLVTRLYANGVLDTDFGANGYRSYSFGLGGTNNDYAHDVAIQPDGQIVVAGSAGKSGGSNFAVLRLSAAGSPVTNFNGGSAVSFSIGSTYDSADSLALQPNGSIVLSGTTYASSDYDVALARLTSGGGFDPAFGGGTGKRQIAVGSEDDSASDLALQPDGKILTAGYAKIAGTYRGTVLRFNTDGSNDVSFGSAGVAVPAPGSVLDQFNAVAVEPSGKIVAAGDWTSDGSSLSTVAGPLITRLNANGTTDTSFGTSGSTLGPVTAGGTSWNRIALEPDGRVAAAGEDGNSHGNGFGGAFTVGMFTADPAPVIPLSSTIAKSLRGRIKAAKLKKFSGTAAGTGVAKVQIALGRPDSKLLKKSKRCLFISSSKGKLKKYKAIKKKCSAPAKWLTAKGTTSWSFKLTGKLKKGKYTLYVRALSASGVAQSKLTRRSFSVK
ncbi:MAG: delta-60 repeat domain-containing protein [Solirubrobacterales bacterium]